MYLKIMGPEDCPDSDTRKTYRLLEGVTACLFYRKVDQASAVLKEEWEEGIDAKVNVVFTDDEEMTFDLVGNAYVMNESGKTISSFGCAPAPESVREDDNPPEFPRALRECLAFLSSVGTKYIRPEDVAEFYRAFKAKYPRLWLAAEPTEAEIERAEMLRDVPRE